MSAVTDAAGPRASMARALAAILLRRISRGSLRVQEGALVTVFGEGDQAAVVEVRSAAAWPLLMRGSRGLARAYADGLWETPDLTAVIRLAARNAGGLDAARRRLAPLLRPAQRLRSLARVNTRRRSRRAIAGHYDLGDELFKMMLDPTMSYSCAVFEDPQATLQDAQEAKLERICAKLGLAEGHRVLEIGGGWGSFALHAARRHGAHVTTTTISANQYEHMQARVHEEGLQEKVTVLDRDYRDLDGIFDRLVSIEMIEAVGWRHFERFFAACSERLVGGGRMLLQAIAIEDGAYEVERDSRSFANTEVFPDGCLPSLAAIRASVAAACELKIVDVEDLTVHYPETLRRWRRRFAANAARLAALGYDERFRRMWSFYLFFCEGGFEVRRILDYQILLAKPHSARGGRAMQAVA